MKGQKPTKVNKNYDQPHSGDSKGFIYLALWECWGCWVWWSTSLTRWISVSSKPASLHMSSRSALHSEILFQKKETNKQTKKFLGVTPVFSGLPQSCLLGFHWDNSDAFITCSQVHWHEQWCSVGHLFCSQQISVLLELHPGSPKMGRGALFLP